MLFTCRLSNTGGKSALPGRRSAAAASYRMSACTSGISQDGLLNDNNQSLVFLNIVTGFDIDALNTARSGGL